MSDNAVEEKEKDTAPPEEGEAEDKPKPLHKTQSIFLRNLAPTITKQEVEAVSIQRKLLSFVLIIRYRNERTYPSKYKKLLEF